MTRLTIRAAITQGGTGYSGADPEGLTLTLRAPRGELLDFLPGKLVVDGTLADGDLTLMSDPEGNRSITYAGVDRDQEQLYDYMQLPSFYAGFEPAEPFLPLDVDATAEPGFVSLDTVPADFWIPRRFQADPRIERVRSMLETMTARQIARQLTRRDRTDFDDVLSGKVGPTDVAPHVAILARVTRAEEE